MAYYVEQKLNCCTWAIAFGEVSKAVRQFIVAFAGVELPSNPTIPKLKNLFLETGSIIKNYSRSNEKTEELVCASILHSSIKLNSLEGWTWNFCPKVFCTDNNYEKK